MTTRTYKRLGLGIGAVLVAVVVAGIAHKNISAQGRGFGGPGAGQFGGPGGGPGEVRADLVVQEVRVDAAADPAALTASDRCLAGSI